MSKQKRHGTIGDAVKAFRQANHNIEYERNGRRWIAVDRPHENKKKYNRKRDRNCGLFFHISYSHLNKKVERYRNAAPPKVV